MLVLDGHATHTKNINLIDYARENGVILLCFPPHTTHKLQPLDKTFMKPLGAYYAEEVRKWLRSNPGRVVTQFQIARLFGAAYLRAATMSVAINGFRETGVWPVDSSMFDDSDFVAAETTDVPMNESEMAPGSDNHQQPSTSGKLIDGNYSPLDLEQKREHRLSTEEQAEISRLHMMSPSVNKCVSQSFNHSPEDIIPIPKTKLKERVNRRRGKTAILTSSPYKKELLTDRSKQKNKKNYQKRLSYEISKCKNNQEDEPKPSTSSGRNNSVENDANCIYCNYKYSESVEGWICCLICQGWSHCSCAGVEEKGEIHYVCSFCE